MKHYNTFIDIASYNREILLNFVSSRKKISANSGEMAEENDSSLYEMMIDALGSLEKVELDIEKGKRGNK